VRAFAAEVGLNADELAREYRARFETELPAGPLLKREADWKDRLRLRQPLPTVLVTIVGILICGSLILERGRVPDEASDGRLLSAVEADLPDNPPQTEDSDGTEEVGFANAAVADVRTPSLRLEIRTKGSCWISAVADGERVIYRLMQSGDRTLVEARLAITLRVGDAGTTAESPTQTTATAPRISTPCIGVFRDSFETGTHRPRGTTCGRKVASLSARSGLGWRRPAAPMAIEDTT
jgi:hypothetical protein